MYKKSVLTVLRTLAQTSSAGVNPPAGFDSLNISRRTSAHHPIAGAFFVPAVRVMAAVRGEPKGSPVPRGRSVNPRTAVSTCLTASSDGSNFTLGIDTMHLPLLRLKCALSPSVIARAKAHRAMALAALRSDSSLKNRLSRYNYHTSIALRLEGKGGAA